MNMPLVRTTHFAYKVCLVLGCYLALVSCENKQLIEIPDAGDALNQNITSNRLELTDIRAYTKKIDVNTHQFSLGRFGSAEVPIVGHVTASFASQARMAVSPTEFNVDPVLDSVFLYLPLVPNADGKFDTDSIYGDLPRKINFAVKEITEFLPHPDTPYASDYQFQLGETIFDQEIELRLDSVTIREEHVNSDGDTIPEVVSAPGIYVRLNNDYFQRKIIDKNGEIELTNNVQFLQHLRGLYFTTSATTDQAIVPINTTQLSASFRLYYNFIENEGETERKNGIALFRIAGTARANHIKLDDNTQDLELKNQLTDPDIATKSVDKVYINGMLGYVMTVDLFSTDEQKEQIKQLVDQNVLVTEAFLEFENHSDTEKISLASPFLSIYRHGTDTLLADNRSALGAVTNGAPARAYVSQLQTDETHGSYRVRLIDLITSIVDGDTEPYLIDLRSTRSSEDLQTSVVDRTSLKLIINYTNAKN